MKRFNWKKVTSLLCALTLLVGIFCLPVAADEPPWNDGVLDWGEDEPPTIVTQPKTATYGKDGQTVTVSVEATGTDLTYQWYIKNDGKTSYSKSSVTTPTYSVVMSDKSNNRRLYCVITDKNGNSVQTNTVLVRRQATITKESATASYAKKGATVQASVTAVGDGLTYTWYFKNASASQYSKASTTKSTYSVTMGDLVKGRRVYCVVKDKYGKTAQSKTFVLRESVSIVTEPKTATYAKSGATAKVTVKAAGDGLKYTWYIKNAGATKYSKSSVTSSTYSVKMSSKVNGRRVYCVVTDQYGNKVQTKTAILREAVSVVTQPKSSTVANGKTAKVTVKASGDGLKYTWYFKNAGATKYSKSSVTSSTYSVKMSSKVNGRRVYCVVTDKYGNKVQTQTVILKKK